VPIGHHTTVGRASALVTETRGSRTRRAETTRLTISESVLSVVRARR